MPYMPTYRIKMSKRRSRLEIMLSILSVIRKGEDKPTRIMYAVNVSWNPTQKMLSSMVEQDLLEVTPGSGKSKTRYVITEKGVNVLDFFEKANEILPNGECLAIAVSI